jgi:hypothetical protein
MGSYATVRGKVKSPMMTESEILNEVVAPDEADLSPEAARSLLALRFSSRARRQMRRLLDRNNKGTITADEEVLLDRYRRVGLFLDLLQAKARLSLRKAAS